MAKMYVCGMLTPEDGAEYELHIPVEKERSTEDLHFGFSLEDGKPVLVALSGDDESETEEFVYTEEKFKEKGGVIKKWTRGYSLLTSEDGFEECDDPWSVVVDGLKDKELYRLDRRAIVERGEE